MASIGSGAAVRVLTQEGEKWLLEDLRDFPDSFRGLVHEQTAYIWVSGAVVASKRGARGWTSGVVWTSESLRFLVAAYWLAERHKNDTQDYGTD